MRINGIGSLPWEAADFWNQWWESRLGRARQLIWYVGKREEMISELAIAKCRDSR